MSSAAADARRRLTARHLFIRISFIVVALAGALLLGELTARTFWRLRFGVPFRQPDRILYAFYPELRRIDRVQPAQSDESYDILLLGGSALYSDWVPDLDSAWGQVAQQLREQLAQRGHRRVRLFNLSLPGHTARDSRLAYATLHHARFDLVVFYHGINEARANNAPPEIFRPDYGHYTWYQVVNALAPYHGSSSFSLPYTLRYLLIRARQAFASRNYVPMHTPREEWVQHGAVARSAESFRRDVAAVLDSAAARGERVALMTFATYVPDDYSREAFLQKRLDYGLHLAPIELWGARTHVQATVAVHNGIVRELATRHAGVLFVDQATLLANQPLYFNDPCHLTVLGSARFVEHLLNALQPTLPTR